MTERQEQLRLNIFKFLRAHRLCSNRQLNQAFWRGKNFRYVDFYMKTLAAAGFVRHVKLPALQPSNYYMLARKGFNVLSEKGLTYEGETLYWPDQGNINLSPFLVKRLMIADVHIALMAHYGTSLASWMPEFEFESKRKDYGIKTNDQKILAAVIPDGLIFLRGSDPNKFRMVVFKYHHFESKRDKFTKRLRNFEHIWANYPKIVMAADPERIDALRTWYREDLHRIYPFTIAGKGISFNDVAKRYHFADLQSLKASEKLKTTALEA